MTQKVKAIANIENHENVPTFLKALILIQCNSAISSIGHKQNRVIFIKLIITINRELYFIIYGYL